MCIICFLKKYRKKSHIFENILIKFYKFENNRLNYENSIHYSLCERWACKKQMAAPLTFQLTSKFPFADGLLTAKLSRIDVPEWLYHQKCTL